jgi:hypothetical protein
MHAHLAEPMRHAASMIVARLHGGFRRVCSANAFGDLHIASDVKVVDNQTPAVEFTVVTRDKTCARDVKLSFAVMGTRRSPFLGRIDLNGYTIVVNAPLSASSTNLEYIAVGSIIAQHVMSEHYFYYAISQLKTLGDPPSVIDWNHLGRSGDVLAVWNGCRGHVVLTRSQLSIKTALGNTTIELSRNVLTEPVQIIRQQIRNAAR